MVEIYTHHGNTYIRFGSHLSIVDGDWGMDDIRTGERVTKYLPGT